MTNIYYIFLIIFKSKFTSRHFIIGVFSNRFFRVNYTDVLPEIQPSLNGENSLVKLNKQITGEENEKETLLRRADI